MAEKIQIQPKFIVFTCGCKLKATPENMELGLCPNKCKKNCGLRIYRSTNSLEETFTEALKLKNNSIEDYLRQCVTGYANSHTDYDSMDNCCSECGQENGLLYFDDNCCQYICEKCYRKILKKVVKKYEKKLMDKLMLKYGITIDMGTE